VSVVAAGPSSSWISVTGKLARDIAVTRLPTLLQHQRASGIRFVRLVMTGVGFRVAPLLQLTGVDRTLFTVTGVTRLAGRPVAEADTAVRRASSGAVIHAIPIC
jgi:hypothetical protein